MALFEDQGFTTTFDTPAGPVLCAVDSQGRLLALHFSEPAADAALLSRLEQLGYSFKNSAARCKHVEIQLKEYFRRERRDFEIETVLHGTEFQKELWRHMATIPYGTTRSYSELASAVGKPRAVRAVGGVCAANRIAVVVPCHRVVGADGSLTGYAGGMPIKRELLALELGQGDLFKRARPKKKKPSQSR
jgi:O-6-methylguanine DNA methyltransferase